MSNSFISSRYIWRLSVVGLPRYLYYTKMLVFCQLREGLATFRGPLEDYRLKPPPFVRKRKYFVLSFAGLHCATIYVKILPRQNFRGGSNLRADQ